MANSGSVSVKLSGLYSQFDPIDPAGTARGVNNRLRPILRMAKDRGAFVNFDGVSRNTSRNARFCVPGMPKT